LRLLDEAVKREELSVMEADHHSRDSSAPQRHPEFEQTPIERAAERHSDRPSELEILQTGTNDATIRFGQFQQLLPDGLRTRFRAEEDQRDALLGIGHGESVPIMVLSIDRGSFWVVCACIIRPEPQHTRAAHAPEDVWI
jgi:hypothetical protein